MNIFEKLPPQIFAPLTGKNNRRSWALIEKLYDTFFAPDRIPTYTEGYLSTEITKDIERFLLDASWDSEDESDSALTSLNIRANQIYRRLVDTGWLAEERIGHVDYINMRPSIARFIETLIHFINDGPQLLGGNILMVYNQIKSVPEDPRGQTSGFMAAAKSCGQLINTLGSMTMRVKDLMDELAKEAATPVIVRRFFTEHISDFYIRDFRQLRTRDHPLRLRYEIIETVQRIIHNPESRKALLQGYTDQLGEKIDNVEEQLERDVSKFTKLYDVEIYLERMDRTIDSATKRAMALLNYRLKASERLEEVIRSVASAINEAEKVDITPERAMLSPMPVLGDYLIRLPVQGRPKPVRTSMKKREINVEEKARRMLRKLMVSHRDATPAAMKRYVEKHIPVGASIRAADLPIVGVDDAVSYLVLSRLASISTHDPEALKHNPLLRRLDFTASLTEPGKRADTPYFNTPDFAISRKGE